MLGVSGDLCLITAEGYLDCLFSYFVRKPYVVGAH